MSFIAKNPLTVPEIEGAPSVPKGARGLVAKHDGWYDVDSNNNIEKITTQDYVDKKIEIIGGLTPETLEELESLIDKESLNKLTLTTSGKGIVSSFENIAPIEHELGVTVTGDGIDLSTVQITRYGKNLFNHNYSSWYTTDDRWYYLDLYVPCNVVVSVQSNAKSTTGKISFYKALVTDENWANQESLSDKYEYSLNNEKLNRVSIEKKSGYKYRIRTSFGVIDKEYIDWIQIEAGSEGSDYEQYIEPTTYMADANGVVKGIIPLYPNTTLISNIDGVTINTRYLTTNYNEVIEGRIHDLIHPTYQELENHIYNTVHPTYPEIEEHIRNMLSPTYQEFSMSDIVHSWWCNPRCQYDDLRDTVYISGISRVGKRTLNAFDLRNDDRKSINLGYSDAPDDHNVPAFLIEDDRPPIVAYSNHGKNPNVWVRVGAYPYDLESLEAAEEKEVSFLMDTETSKDGECSYSSLIRKPDSTMVALITRFNNKLRISISDDWGTRWSVPKDLANYLFYGTFRVSANKKWLNYVFTSHPTETASNTIRMIRIDLKSGDIYGVNPVTHTVQFYSRDVLYRKFSVRPDKVVKIFDNPISEGAEFIGWYLDTAFTTPYTFDTAIKSDLTVYAKWSDSVPTEPETPAEPEIIASGTCGDNLTYTLDSNGLLTISGTGDMSNWDYEGNEEAPWYTKCDLIKTVEIGEGVTSIGSGAFYNCTNFTIYGYAGSVAELYANDNGIHFVAIDDTIGIIGNLWSNSFSTIITDTITNKEKNVEKAEDYNHTFTVQSGGSCNDEVCKFRTLDVGYNKSVAAWQLPVYNVKDIVSSSEKEDVAKGKIYLTKDEATVEFNEDGTPKTVTYNGYAVPRDQEIDKNGNITKEATTFLLPNRGGVYGVFYCTDGKGSALPQWSFEKIVHSGVPVGYYKSGYIGGMCFTGKNEVDDEVLLCREQNGTWYTEKWTRNVTPNGATWERTEELCVSQNKLGRPQVPWNTGNKDISTFVRYQKYSADSYNAYYGDQIVYTK